MSRGSAAAESEAEQQTELEEQRDAYEELIEIADQESNQVPLRPIAHTPLHSRLCPTSLMIVVVMMLVIVWLMTNHFQQSK